MWTILILVQEQFPDPKCLVDNLHQNGFKAIWMLDPGIKFEKGYFVYDSGSEKDIWVQTADGKPFVGKYMNFTLVLLEAFVPLFGLPTIYLFMCYVWF